MNINDLLKIKERSEAAQAQDENVSKVRNMRTHERKTYRGNRNAFRDGGVKKKILAQMEKSAGQTKADIARNAGTTITYVSAVGAANRYNFGVKVWSSPKREAVLANRDKYKCTAELAKVAGASRSYVQKVLQTLK